MLRFRLKSLNWRDLLKELFIVVLGILIAFALNNWAQNRSNDSLLQDYLISLRTDLAADTVEMTENLNVLHRNMAFVQSLMPHFYREMPGRDTIAASFFKRSIFPYFNAHDATVNTLINTGNLKLIQSFELKKALLDHYDKYDLLYQENERAESFVRDYVAKYMMTEIDQGVFFQSSGDAALKDFKFRNIAFSVYGIIQIQEKRYNEALERARKLMRML
jgi:hypothetical protein